MTKWTPEREAWLAENYHAGSIVDTADAFEREFGERPGRRALFVKANKMGLRKDTHGDERYAPAQCRIRWSEPKWERQREWMLEHDAGESVHATIDAFEREFGIRLNRQQVSGFRSSHGTQRRNARGGGHPARPVGSERAGKGGYTMVKVREFPDVPGSKDNWRFKHHIAWEQANGRPLPEGWTVFFADHDKRNFDPANLVAVPRKYIAQLNNPALPGYSDRETLLACVALCDLRTATADAEKARGRECAVCGATFEPTAAQSRYPQAVKTCPECLASGRKAMGRRGTGERASCCVCGAAFAPKSKNQRRCPECIAAKPKHSPDAHMQWHARHGG